MQYSQWKKSGLMVSRVSLGTAQFGNDYGFTREKTMEEVYVILQCAAEQGINFLDTARDYGASEEKIGRFLETYPESDFHIATKIAKFPSDLLMQKSPVKVKDHILKSIEMSLKALGRDAVDVLQLHQLDQYLIECETVWVCLEELHQEGLVKAIGVSVYDPEETQRLLQRHGNLLDCIQIPFNIFDQRFLGLLPAINAAGINVLSRSVFLRGMIPGPAERLPPELTDLRPYKNRLNELAQKRQAKVEELAFLFVVGQQDISSTLIGVDSVKELKEVISWCGRGKMAKELLVEAAGFAIEDSFLIDPRRWRS